MAHWTRDHHQTNPTIYHYLSRRPQEVSDALLFCCFPLRIPHRQHLAIHRPDQSTAAIRAVIISYERHGVCEVCFTSSGRYQHMLCVSHLESIISVRTRLTSLLFRFGPQSIASSPRFRKHTLKKSTNLRMYKEIVERSNSAGQHMRWRPIVQIICLSLSWPRNCTQPKGESWSTRVLLRIHSSNFSHRDTSGDTTSQLACNVSCFELAQLFVASNFYILHNLPNFDHTTRTTLSTASCSRARRI